MSIHKQVAALVLAGCCLLTSCSFLERKGVDTATPFLEHTVNNLLRLENARLAKEGLAGQILLISALCEFTPQNATLLTLASQAYASFGLLVEEEDPGYAEEVYEVGKGYGLQALAYENHAFQEGLARGTKIAYMADRLKKDDVPAAFWYGMNTGLGLMLALDNRVVPLESDHPEKVAQMGDLAELFKKILELDDSYFFYAPRLFQGAYYMLIGPLIGGGSEPASREFSIAFKKTENRFLLTHVFYARYYLTNLPDKGRFQKTLTYVLNTQADVMPEAALANAIAKEKARWLLEHQDLFFNP